MQNTVVLFKIRDIRVYEVVNLLEFHKLYIKKLVNRSPFRFKETYASRMDSEMNSMETTPEVTAEDENSHTFSTHEAVIQNGSKKRMPKVYICLLILVVIISILVALVIIFATKPERIEDTSNTGQ